MGAGWVLYQLNTPQPNATTTVPPTNTGQQLLNADKHFAGGLRDCGLLITTDPVLLSETKQLVWRLTSVLRPLGGWSMRILNSRPAWTWIGQSKTLSQEEPAGLGGHLRHSPRGSSLVPRIQVEMEGENWHYAVYSVVFWLQQCPTQNNIYKSLK